MAEPIVIILRPQERTSEVQDVDFFDVFVDGEVFKADVAKHDLDMTMTDILDAKVEIF